MHSDEAREPAGVIADLGVDAVIRAAQCGDAEAISVIDHYARQCGTHSPAWHAMRRTGIGGSDVAACLGLNPYRAPIDVYAEKIGELEGFAGNERTRWGQILEPVIAEEYQNRRGGAEQCHLDGPHATQRSTDHPWHLYSLDYTVVEAEGNAGSVQIVRADKILRVLEVKSRGFFMRSGYGDEGTDEIPFADGCQLAWYIAGVKCDGGGDLAALFNTHELRVFHAERDLDLEASLLEQVEQWWQQHVVARVPPEADGSKAYANYLRRRFDKTASNLLEPDAETIELHRRLRAVECLARTVGAAKEQLRQQLQARCGDAQGFVLPAALGKKSMFKHDSRGKVNHSEVAEDLADRLKLSYKALKLLQDANRHRPARKWYSPRVWLEDEIEPAELGTAVAEVVGLLQPKPE